MKCMYNQSKRGLPSDVRTMALKVAKEMLALQVDAVVSRAWNEMLVAMEQSGLSAKTINKTREKLTEVVLPYVDDLRNPNGGLKNAGNPQKCEGWRHLGAGLSRGARHQGVRCPGGGLWRRSRLT